MGTGVFSEIGALMRDHPYVSCSLLIFLTPPFFPILKFFSPLLISTALFVVALVTMGPQFQGPSEQEGDLQDFSEMNSEGEAGLRTGDARRQQSSKKIRLSPGDWIKSCKDAGLAWAEQKLFRNENWRGASLNDDNVSILQEAFAYRAEEKPRVMMRLVTRRIPAEEERVAEEYPFRRHDVPKLSNSGAWKPSHSPDRSFGRRPSFSAGSNTQELPHSFFSPHPILSWRRDSDTLLFENVGRPPIEHDMPSVVNGPATMTAPIFRSFDNDIDSDDEYDNHHNDHDEHMHLEVGERSLDADSLSQDELPVTNGTYDQPPPFTVKEENLPSSSDSDEERSYFAHWHQGNRATESTLPTMHGAVRNRDMDLNEEHSGSALRSHEVTTPYFKDVSEEHLPLADIVHEERPITAPQIDQESHPPPITGHQENLQLNKDIESHDMPELEDVERGSSGIPVAVVEGSSWRESVAESMPPDHLDTDVVPGDVPASRGQSDVSEAPADHNTDSKEPEVLAGPKYVSVEPHRFVERSMSLPVLGSLATTDPVELPAVHEDHTQLDEPLPDDVQEPVHQSYVLSNAISLPARSSIQPIVIPPRTGDPGPRSPDTDLGYATTPDHDRRGVAARFSSTERYNSITSISGDESELALPAKQLSTKEKLSNLEALCNSMPSPASGEKRCLPADHVAILRSNTDEQVTHVADKLKGYIDDSPSKKFQRDAPQLQITPPSSKVLLNTPPSKSAALASALGRPSIRPVISFSRTYGGVRYSSSEVSSEDEQIDLDSDVEADCTDSESDIEIVQSSGKSRLKPPPKPPAKICEP